jgi:uncharacterized membrane protein YeaQ/YmgE (transglycosylase-associated protein family)
MLWVTVGLLAGALTKWAMPHSALLASKMPWGAPGDLILSLMGALAAGRLFINLLDDTDRGWIGSTFVAFFGAVLVLLAPRFVIRGRTA